MSGSNRIVGFRYLVGRHIEEEISLASVIQECKEAQEVLGGERQRQVCVGKEGAC